MGRSPVAALPPEEAVRTVRGRRNSASVVRVGHVVTGVERAEDGGLDVEGVGGHPGVGPAVVAVVGAVAGLVDDERAEEALAVNAVVLPVGVGADAVVR